MPVIRYDIGVYAGRDNGFSMPVYVQISDRCREYGSDIFADDVNGCGPSAELEGILSKKLHSLEEKMAEAVGARKDAFKNVLEYSFPLELYDDVPLNVEPDYVYQWDREYALFEEELVDKWNSIKKERGVESLNPIDYFLDIARKSYPELVDIVTSVLTDCEGSYKQMIAIFPVFSTLSVDSNISDPDQQMHVVDNIIENLELLQ